MKARDFCYWLQGHFEIGGSNKLTEAQVVIIKNHLALVFASDIDLEDPPELRDKFQNIHDGTSHLKPPRDTLIKC